MRKKILCLICVSVVLVMSACGSATTQVEPSTSNKSQPNASQPQVPPVSQVSPTNIETSPDPSAAQAITSFYQYLNEKNYTLAVALLGPQIKFEGDQQNIKYLKNIKKATFTKLVDISSNPGPIYPSETQYFQVKVYYGEMTIEVQNPNLVEGLAGVNYRKFILIKKAKTDSWQIDMDESTPKQ